MATLWPLQRLRGVKFVRMRWKTTSAALLRRLRDSGSTAAIPREEWPAFCAEIPGIVGAWGWPTTAPITIRSDGTTVHGVNGVIDVLRLDAKAPSSQRVKAYRHVLAESTDGTVRRAGPFRDVDYGHWRSGLPSWASTNR